MQAASFELPLDIDSKQCFREAALWQAPVQAGSSSVFIRGKPKNPHIQADTRAIIIPTEDYDLYINKSLTHPIILSSASTTNS